MEQDQEKKEHVCKLCNKSFSSGRILVGHMRIHGVKNSAKEDVNLENSDMGNDGSYGLRENPKKSWKSSNLNGSECSDQEIVKCRICGRQFESPRSLHGHMRHHSVQERNAIHCKECGKRFKTVRSLTGHMRLHSSKYRVFNESRTSSGPNLVLVALSDAKTVNLVRRKRSNRMRYRVSATPNSSISSLKESVSGFEIDREDEEAAMCLMMLSRGVYEWGELKSVGESLDDDSMSFEAKFLYGNKGTESNEDEVDGFDGDELGKKKKPRVEKFDSCASDSKNKTSECIDCDGDMVCFEEKKMELELRIVSYSQAVDSKKPEVGCEFGLVVCDNEKEKETHDEVDSNTTELDSSQDYKDIVGSDLASLELVKCTPGNENVIDTCDAEMGKDSFTEMICTTSDFIDCKKRNRFQCKICNRIFPTHQSLGGHQTLHRAAKSSSSALKIEHFQENFQADILPEKIDAASEASKLDSIKGSVGGEENGMITASYQLKKSKNHQCPICFKFFLSGQALGGHRKAHLPKVKEEQNMAVPKDFPNACDALELKVPAMIASAASGEPGFKPWWPETSYKHESVIAT